MNRDIRKNLIPLLEEYLKDENNIMIKNKLLKMKQNNKYNFGFTNGIIHKRSLRKNLVILKDNETIKDNIVKYDGLYHERSKDLYDVWSMDCVESPFCMNHKRKGEFYHNYKKHYCCKYNNKIVLGNKKGLENKNVKWISNKFVCFNCQIITKRKPINSQNDIYSNWPKCNSCNNYMESVGVEFQAPPKNDKKKWDKLNKEWYDDSRITFEEYNKIEKNN